MAENGLRNETRLEPIQKEKETKESRENRPTFKNELEFYLNVVGYNIGLGTVWRFSYLCYKNGGGAFLIPYALFMLCCGLPVMFLEIAMGQFTKQSCIRAWGICPILQGVGYASLQIAGYFLAYINVVMGWCLFYLVHSFTTDVLPWARCDNLWNSEYCEPISTIEVNSSVAANSSPLFTENSTQSYLQDQNGTSSVKEFWSNYVLQKSDGIENIGGFTNWRMLLCYLLSWVVSYLCIYKGIKSTSKVVYVTVPLPYVMVLVLLIRGVTLDGAVDGILFYVTPVISRLGDSTVWIDAGSQVLFTLGVCYNVLYSCGSYNKFNANCLKQTYVFVLVCCFTSLLIGFAVFSIIGHMAFVRDKPVSEVAEGGPGLVFEVFPFALSLLPKSQIWSSLFFAMLLFIAIDSSFATMEGFLTTLGDLWPRYFGERAGVKYRIGFCVLIAIAGLPLLCDGGIYIFEILNNYGGSGICILWTTFFEAFGIAWIYGIDKFFQNVKSMIGYSPHVLFKLCYMFVTPVIILAIFLFYCASYSPLTVGNYVYPWWANFIGWLISGGVIASIPVIAMKTLLKAEGSLKQRWIQATTPKIPDFLPHTEEEMGALV